ncbi:ATP phosphoribosyltransferase regulatory subunit [Magnetospira sp. QH-2]|uniref:ATP phosphoribosyltransferase regulatory subunit n=1 Tax=Magnetospira sp. (strain QH-2) TaxID=1288970 RepID=UPI0003E80A63|nr:ATP phosphoribosyltransferase regulatory subunit [Magnetospira sp. QH-2]CCQ75173.1 ATP phosphoribosyltransferase regulatory subunit [Magnetospira sp. QH-2]
MNQSVNKALLPAGLRDILPPNAAHEARVVETLVSTLESHGYDRVKPPLIEFEDNLLDGSGAALAERSFRLMDPASHRMLAVRPDMTLQIARIAASRLGKEPRPLRLAYAGEILRIHGSQLRPERQFGQVGAELIGADGPQADAEMILMAVEALQSVGVTDLSVDLGLPTLVPLLGRHFGLDEQTTDALRFALDRKDAGEVADLVPSLGQTLEPVLQGLLTAAGPAHRALEILNALDLPDEAAEARAALSQVVERLQAGAPDLTVTIDPVENRGFEYHTGVTFAFFARQGRGELGRGGRYIAAGAPDGNGEPATGLTLFMNAVLRVLPDPEMDRRIYVPLGTDAATGHDLRATGWITIDGLEDTGDVHGEARRLRCSHAWTNGRATALDNNE